MQPNMQPVNDLAKQGDKNEFRKGSMRNQKTRKAKTIGRTEREGSFIWA